MNRSDQMEQLLEALKPMARNAHDAFSVQELPRVRVQLLAAANTALDISREQVVLNSLHFQSINVRQENVAQAHTNTFEWVFESSDSESPQSRLGLRFIQWLQQSQTSNGTFWVAGKAGSGKSTFMKFIYHHPKTRRALEQWSDGSRIIIGNFFFWHAGTALQKSQEGLMQSLLYEVFRQCPELIQEICPRRWNLALVADQEIWSRTELFETLHKLSSQAKMSAKFCFFIDGLDETDRHPAELVEALKKLAALPNIKLCVSSRPWEIFKKAYDGNHEQRLYLQDLTRGDIELYVRSKFGEHEELLNAMSADLLHRGLLQSLMTSITSKAQGVFLWTYLVVRSLLTGLQNGDTIAILHRRLEELPEELEDLFQRMLNSVENVYKQETARTFQVALTAVGPLHGMVYYYIDEEEPSGIVQYRLCSLSEEEIYTRQELVRKRLNAVSKGLLEVSDGHNPTPYFQFKVDFLHRTVQDFLADHQHMLSKTISPDSRTVHVSICSALLTVLKTCPFEPTKSNAEALNEVFEDLGYHAFKAEAKTGEPQSNLLDEIRSTIALRANENEFKREWAISQSTASHMSLALTSFPAFCVQSGLCLYVERLISKDRSLVQEIYPTPGRTKRTLLDSALRPLRSKKYERRDLLPMLKLLLRNGADLNQITSESGTSHDPSFGGTPWARFLTRVTQLSSITTNDLDMISFLLRHGADPNVSVGSMGDITLWGCFLDSKQFEFLPDSSNLAFRVVKTFITHGADPNRPFETGTIWQDFLAKLYATKSHGRPGAFWSSNPGMSSPATDNHYAQLDTETFESDLIHEKIELLISAGASPNTTVTIYESSIQKHNEKPVLPCGDFSAADIIRRCLPEEHARRLLALNPPEYKRRHLSRSTPTSSLAEERSSNTISQFLKKLRLSSAQR